MAEDPGAVGEDLIALITNDEREAIARLVTEHPAAARARGRDGVSALLHALYRGRNEIAELLDAAGAERDVFNSAGLGKCDRLRSLLDADAAIHGGHSADGWTPLHLAAFFGHVGAVRLLIERGADARAVSRNRQANHPLHAACAAGQSEAALVLIAAGADANYAAAGFTPLHIAAANGLPQVVDALLKRGADSAARDPAGRTAREHAQEKGHTAVEELLAHAKT